MPLPLHIFEPRYQQMIAECLEEGHSFGVVAIREGAETGVATPHDVGTLAKIVRIERLTDGRMNLLVSGASRFEIVKMATDRPYLRGEVRIIPESSDDTVAARLTRQTGIAFAQYSRLVRTMAGEEAEDIQPPVDPEILSYLVAAALNLELGEKQALLAQRRTDERLALELRILRKEIALLKEMIARSSSATSRASLN